MLRRPVRRSDAPLVHFDLAGPANGKPGYYEWDKNNFAPRFAVGVDAAGRRGLLGRADRQRQARHPRRLLDRLRPHRHRAGDQLRPGRLLRALDRRSRSPFGGNNEDDPAIRFQGLDVIPPTLPDAPPGGFPQTPPSYAGIITEALDGNIVTPYAHSFNVVVGRELGHGYSIEGGVRRPSRTQSAGAARRRRCRPTSWTPKSGVDYFTAAAAADQRVASASRATADLAAYSGIAPIPYWENLFPDAAAGRALGHPAHGGRVQRPRARLHHRRSTTPTSAATRRAARSGAFAFFAPQYDTLGVQSTIGRSQYDAMQVSRAQAVQRRLPVRRELHARATRRITASLLEGDTVFAQLQQRRLHRLPDRLVGPGQAVRQRRTTTSGTW